MANGERSILLPGYRPGDTTLQARVDRFWFMDMAAARHSLPVGVSGHQYRRHRHRWRSYSCGSCPRVIGEVSDRGVCADKWCRSETARPPKADPPLAENTSETTRRYRTAHWEFPVSRCCSNAPPGWRIDWGPTPISGCLS